MSIHDLLTPNMYDINVNKITIGTSQTDSFRKMNSNFQAITPLDPAPTVIAFDTFVNKFTYLDNTPNNCFTFLDNYNIKINKTGIYQLFCEVALGNETPGSYVIIGINLQGTVVAMSESIVISGNSVIPFNNGLHSQNTSVVLATMAHLKQNDIIQIQYVCSANSDIYPGSYVAFKYLSI